MAKPQAEEGFVMIALDLFVALMTSDIPNRDAIVLTEIIVQSYGPAKRRNVHIDPPTQEDVTGQHRNNVRAALKALVDANLIERNGDGTYSFLKDYERYRPAGHPFSGRLGGGLLMFARNVKARFGRANPSRKTPIQSDSGRGPDPNPTGLTTSVGPQSNGIGAGAYENVGSVDANATGDTTSGDGLACVGAHAPEDLKTLHSHTRGVSGLGDEPFVPPPAPAGPAKFGPIGANPAAEVERAFRATTENYPDDGNMWTWVRMWLHDRPASEVIPQLIKAKGKGKPEAWIEKVLSAPRPPGAAPAAPRPVHVAPADSLWRRNDAAVLRRKAMGGEEE